MKSFKQLPIIILLLSSGFNTMAQKIKIATIGNLPVVDSQTVGQGMVDQTIEFWDKELKQVLHENPDLIVLPEHAVLPWRVGYDEIPEWKKVKGDQLLNFFKKIAKNHHTYIAYGELRTDEEGRKRNQMLLIDKNGNLIGNYNKMFPTTYEMDRGIFPGVESKIFKTSFGSMGPSICFDINFEELSDQLAEQKPNIVLFSSSGGYSQEQEQWANKIGSYLVGAISSKTTEATIRNPVGYVIASSNKEKGIDYAIVTVDLDARYTFQWDFRKELEAAKKKYGNEIQIIPEGAAVKVYSPDGKLNIDKVFNEFKISTPNQYYDNTRRMRNKMLSNK